MQLRIHRKEAPARQSERERTPLAPAPGKTSRPPAWATVLPLQPKLAVNQPGDAFEQEAEAIAEQVTRIPTPGLQRCACGGVAGPDGECAACKAKRLVVQRKASRSGAVSEAPPSVHQALRSPGQPLDSGVRRALEPRFGQDFSGVRVHTDSQAAQSAQEVGARAYTVGQHVVFAAGQYTPGTSAGDRLIAHELTHTMQQGYDGAAVQRDLARPPTGVPAPLVALTEAQIAEAIEFNQARFSDPYSIAVIRDVIGVSRFPAVVDEEMVQAVVRWQSERRMTQDGKVGHQMTRTLVLELIAEGQLRDAVLLIIDSYRLATTSRVGNVRVGTGPNCCGTAANPADAVTFGGVCPPVGGLPNVCVCRTSLPPAVDYNHFVRIIGHEFVHVPHCGGAALDLHATEFDAFFWEACGEGRAPRLTAAQRVGHANTALGHFALLTPAARTPARIAQRDQLNRLIAAGGAGACT